MKRRTLLVAAGAALAAPAVRAAPAPVLRFVPYVDLPVLDPVANTASQVRNHGFLVFDTLFGLDSNYAPQPQMLEGFTTSPDGLEWRLVLRPGLRFHDGTPVLARDVVASLKRWAVVDGFGMALFAATAELSAADDRTTVFRLHKPFPLLPAALGKMSPNMPAIMPERLAATPPNRPVPELVGSGPFRFVQGEYVAGSRLVYERFADYVPRPEGEPGFTSGPKRVFVDRVVWQVMPEPATAANALRAGEVDWWEAATPDLQSMLRNDRSLALRVNDVTGVLPVLRFNCIQPPFDNHALRRAVLGAIDQAEFMAAYSDDKALSRTGVGVFCPGTPYATEAGMAGLFGKLDLSRARKAVADSGYRGETAVVLGPTDHPVNSVTAQVGADLLTRIGLKVDLQAMDAATMFNRRTNREGIDKGGWSVFPSAVAGIDSLDPAESFLVRGNGAKAWYGWPDDKAMERDRLAFYDAPDEAARRRLCDSIQAEVLGFAPHVPLGQILQPTAYRRNLEGMLPGFAKFWNVRLANG